MKFVMLLVIAFPFFKKKSTSTESYIRAKSLLSSKNYEEAGNIADSLIHEGYKDKDVLYVLMYSLYQRRMWDSIVSITRRLEEFRLSANTKEYSDIMFMCSVAYLQKQDVALAICYASKSAKMIEGRKRGLSFLKDYIGISYLPEDISYKWLIKPERVGILTFSDIQSSEIGDFINGFIIGGGGSIPYVKLNSLKDVSNVSLLVGPMLSENIAKSRNFLKSIFQPAIFPLSQDIRIPTELPIFSLNRRYAIELEKGINLFADRLGYMNFAIFYDESDPVSISARYFLKREILKRGLYVTFEKPFTEDSISIISEIDSTTGENWDAVFVLGRNDFALTLATTFRREVEDLPVFIFSDFKWRTLHGGYLGLNGVIFAGYYTGERKMLDILSLKQQFADTYETQFGTYPSYFSMRGYDVGRLIKKMATELDTFNRKNVIDYLYNLKVYEGISGYFLFRDDPTLIKVYTFKNGKIVEYKEE